MRSAAALLAAAVIAGCGGAGGEEEKRPGPGPRPPSDRALIASWLEALNDRDYRRAAGFFARGAIVDQGQAIRLPNRAAAIAFNRSLPCKGKLTRVEDEGRTSLGTFDLAEGSGGPSANCDGAARVRFTIRKGRFTEWRQLPEPAVPPGVEA